MPSYQIHEVNKKYGERYYVATHHYGGDRASWNSTFLTEEELAILKKVLCTENLIGTSFESSERTFDEAIIRLVHPWIVVKDLTTEVIIPALIQGVSPRTRDVYDIEGWIHKIYGRDYLTELNTQLAPHNLSIQEVDGDQFRFKVKGECIYCQLVSETGTRNLFFTPSMDLFRFEDDLKK